MTNIKALGKLRKLKGKVVDYRCGVVFDRAVDDLEAEIVERFVELPCDADGVLIHVGDVVQGLGDAGPVQHVELWDDGWVVVFEFAPGQFTRYSGDAVRHYKPRTIEDVLEDFVRNGVEPISRENREVDLSEVAFCIDKGEMRKYAAEIRELMGVKE